MKGKSLINIKFVGSVFDDINTIIKDENERLETTLILYSKMADIYTKVFESNKKIKLISREVYGDIIIDDNHVDIKWSVNNAEIEFYFEEYWGIIELYIDSDNSEMIIKEIVSAFESYYNMKFGCSVSKRKFEDEWIFDLEIVGR